jgi:hypothetical protein
MIYIWQNVFGLCVVLKGGCIGFTETEINIARLTYFNNQLNAQIIFFYNNMYVTLQSSTCFEH